MSTPSVYLAGPIQKTTDQEANDWRNTVRQAIEAAHFKVIDPMMRDFRGKKMTSNNIVKIVEGDKDDIDACHLLFANCWQVSVGTSMEILYACESEIPVISIVPSTKDASPWIVYHSDLIFENLASGIKAAIKIMKD